MNKLASTLWKENTFESVWCELFETVLIRVCIASIGTRSFEYIETLKTETSQNCFFGLGGFSIHRSEDSTIQRIQ